MRGIFSSSCSRAMLPSEKSLHTSVDNWSGPVASTFFVSLIYAFVVSVMFSSTYGCWSIVSYFSCILKLVVVLPPNRQYPHVLHQQSLVYIFDHLGVKRTCLSCYIPILSTSSILSSIPSVVSMSTYRRSHKALALLKLHVLIISLGPYIYIN